jgi:hypothetical protein
MQSVVVFREEKVGPVGGHFAHDGAVVTKDDAIHPVRRHVRRNFVHFDDRTRIAKFGPRGANHVERRVVHGSIIHAAATQRATVDSVNWRRDFARRSEQ